MGNTATDRAPITNGRMTNVMGSLYQKRKTSGSSGIAFKGCIAGHCSYCHAAIPDAYIGQLSNTIKIDQHARSYQAHVHQRYQALSTCQHTGLITVLSKQLCGLLDTLGRKIAKTRRFQSKYPPFLGKT